MEKKKMSEVVKDLYTKLNEDVLGSSVSEKDLAGIPLIVKALFGDDPDVEVSYEKEETEAPEEEREDTCPECLCDQDEDDSLEDENDHRDEDDLRDWWHEESCKEEAGTEKQCDRCCEGCKEDKQDERAEARNYYLNLAEKKEKTDQYISSIDEQLAAGSAELFKNGAKEYVGVMVELPGELDDIVYDLLHETYVRNGEWTDLVFYPEGKSHTRIGLFF